MAQEHNKTISIKCFTDIQEEAIAHAVITPGMLIERLSTAKVQAHSSAGANQEWSFALENELEGQGIDDDYAADDIVQYKFFRRGDIVNALLADDSAAVVIGDLLESNGDGALKKYVADTADSDDPITVYPNQIVGMAEEALDLSGSSGEESSGLLNNARIQVRIL